MRPWFKLCAAAAIFCAVLSPAGATIIVAGPDAFGYRAALIQNNLRHISFAGGAGGTYFTSPVLGSANVPLNFSFTFYGNTYDHVSIWPFGYVTFSNSNTPLNLPIAFSLPTLLPSVYIRNTIAVAWFELSDPVTPLFQTLGQPGSREFVVGWYNARPLSAGGNLETFELILHEGTDDIEFQYGALYSIGNQNFSMGIQNYGPQSISMQIGYGDGTGISSFSNKAFCISTRREVECQAASASSVPEPNSLWLFGSAVLGLGFVRFRGRSARTDTA